MKKIIFLLLCICSFSFLYSQNFKIGYTYDLDGNLIKRKVVEINVPQAVKRQDNDSVNDIKDVLGEQKITLFPNPTSGAFKVVINALNTNDKNYYQLFSLTGTLLGQRNIKDENIDFDISSYPSGAYLLNIYLGKKVSLWKIIKK